MYIIIYRLKLFTEILPQEKKKKHEKKKKLRTSKSAIEHAQTYGKFDINDTFYVIVSRHLYTSISYCRSRHTINVSTRCALKNKARLFKTKLFCPIF